MRVILVGVLIAMAAGCSSRHSSAASVEFPSYEYWWR